MGALGLVFRAELRRRGRAWLALALLVAVVGGVVLAAAAAGQRTADAFPSYLSRYGFDVALYADKVDLTRFPEVARSTVLVGTDNGQPACACTHSIDANEFGLVWVPTGQGRISKLVAGRMPNPARPDEVLASYTMQHDLGLHIGSVVRVPFFSPAQAAAYNNSPTGALTPEGPTVSFRVTGFEASEFDFPTGGTPNYDLFVTAAFARQTLPHVAYGYVYAVTLRHGSADLARFARDTGALGEPSNQDANVGAVESSIHPQAVGWWILALLAALVGLAVVGQALFRQSALEAVDFPVLGTLGADRALLIALGSARNVVIGVLGAVGAVGVATALSPLAPLGEAGVAELHTGVTFDGSVLALGAVAIVVAVVGLGTAAVMRTASTRPVAPRWPTRPSAVVAGLAGLGAPPSVVVGVRSALERRSGTGAVPVGTAMLGTVLAVTALVGTAVFGASLAHLDATPRLYGDDAQLNFTNPEPNQTDATVMRMLEHDPAVNDITTGFAVEIQVNGDAVGAIVGTAVRGPLLLSAVTGALPTGPGEISLGRATMRQLHVHVGSRVHVSLPVPTGGVRTTAFTVVSQVAFPVLGGQVSLGNGAALTYAGYAAAVCTLGQAHASCRARPVRRRNRRRRARQFRARGAGTRRPDPVPAFVDGRGGRAARPHLARQLRRGGRLPASVRRHAGGVGCSHSRAFAGGECQPASARHVAVEGHRVRQRSGGVGHGVAGDDRGARGHRHRAAPRDRGRPSGVACLRLQLGRGAGGRRPGVAPRRGPHRRLGGGQPPRHRAGLDGGPLPARGPPAHTVTRGSGPKYAEKAVYDRRLPRGFWCLIRICRSSSRRTTRSTHSSA